MSYITNIEICLLCIFFLPRISIFLLTFEAHSSFNRKMGASFGKPAHSLVYAAPIMY